MPLTSSWSAMIALGSTRPRARPPGRARGGRRRRGARVRSRGPRRSRGRRGCAWRCGAGPGGGRLHPGAFASGEDDDGGKSGVPWGVLTREGSRSVGCHRTASCYRPVGGRSCPRLRPHAPGFPPAPPAPRRHALPAFRSAAGGDLWCHLDLGARTSIAHPLSRLGRGPFLRPALPRRAGPPQARRIAASSSSRAESGPRPARRRGAAPPPCPLRAAGTSPRPGG